MKKWIIPIAGLALLIACMAAVLFSCNGNTPDDPAQTTPASTTASVQDTTPAPTEETTPAETTPAETTPETTPAETMVPETTPAPTQPSGGSNPGGTGGFEGGQVPDTPSEEEKPQEVVIPEPGSEGNPFAEAVASLPDSFAIISVPADAQVCYRITGLQGNVLTISDEDAYVVLEGKTYAPENGVLTLAIPAAEQPGGVKLIFGNRGSSEKSFVLDIQEPLGGKTNPQVLSQMADQKVSFGAYQSQYYYIWTATEPGVLILQPGTVTPAGSCTVTMTCGENTSTTDENGTAISLAAGDTVTICVTRAPAGEGTVELRAQFISSLGTLESPIPIEDPDAPFTAAVPAGKTLYYAGHLAGMTLTLENAQGTELVVGEQTIPADANGKITYTFPTGSNMGRPEANVFALVNTTAEDQTHTLNFAHPVGSAMNPARLVLGENRTQIPEGGQEGYNYTWIATRDGVLILEFAGDNWQYTLNNLTAGNYGDIQDASMVPSAAKVMLPVTRGDEISLMVNGFDPADPFAYPGGTVSFTAAAADVPGSKTNPIEFTGVFPLVTQQIPAGQTLYYNVWGADGLVLNCADPDAKLTVAGEAYTGGVLQGQIRQPILIGVTNTGSQEEKYILNFAAVPGSYENPDRLVLGENTAVLEANDADGYTFVWTASGNGKLTLDFAGNGWQYTVNNETAGIYGDLHADETPNLELSVSQGDRVTVNVNTFTAGTMDTPAGIVSFTAAFSDSQQTEPADPILIDDLSQPYPAELPANQTVYYTGNIYGVKLVAENAYGITLTLHGTTYEADENGHLEVDFPAYTGMGRPENVVFGISNGNGYDGFCMLNFQYPLGAPQNPDELVLGENTARLLAGNQDGYTFAWTAEANGTLTVTMPESGWVYTVNNLTAGIYGDTHTAGDDPLVPSETLTVSAGDEITVVVNTFDPESWNAPAGTVTFTADFTTVSGTETNPIRIDDLSVPFPVEIPAGETLYYTGNIYGVELVAQNARDLTLTLGETSAEADENGKLSLPFPAYTGMGRPTGVVFSLTNNGSEAAATELTFLYPVGAPQNPETLVMGTNIATLEANATDGYTFTWTADADGKLTVTMAAENWQYVLNNLTAGIYGDTHTAADDPLVSSQTLEVAAGDEITLVVNTFDAASWDTPAGTVELTASFDSKLGSEEFPIWINDTTVPFDTQVPAGQTRYYTGRLFDVDVRLENAQGVTLTLGENRYEADENGVLALHFPASDGMGRPQPVVFTLTNASEADGSYRLVFIYPEGTLENPAQLVMGANTATLQAGNTNGYNYTWTAPEAGKLTVTMPQSGWQYVLSNETSGIYGESHTAGDETPVPSETVEVARGDKITLVVSTFTPDSFETVAGSVVFTAEFEPKVGSEEEPIHINDLSVPFATQIGAGKTRYYSGRIFQVKMMVENAPGLILTLGENTYEADENGVLTVSFPASTSMGRPEPIVFSMTNTGESYGQYSLVFIYPEGTPQNPDALKMGANTATLEAGNTDGYIYRWTAAEDGKLTVTMPESGWSYCVSNLTSGVYGNTHTAGDETLVPSETMEVTAGQQIELVVSTFSADSWETPAGSVVFQATFTPVIGGEENPILITDLEVPFEANIPLGQSRYYSGRIFSVDVKIDNAAGLTLTLGENTYTPDENGTLLVTFPASASMGRPEPVTFCITNGAGSRENYSISFLYPEGTPQNPDELKIGSNTATLEAGNTDGYTYRWIAPEDGKLTLTMPEAGWSYTVNNLTSGVYGDTHTAGDETLVPSQTLEVTAGQEIEAVVSTFDPQNSWEAPAGSVVFTAAFAPLRGSEEQPILIQDLEAPFDTTLASGQTLYYAGNIYNLQMVAENAENLSFAMGDTTAEAENGVLAVSFPAYTGMGRPESVVFTLTNTGSEEMAVSLTFRHPVGAPQNPDALVLGENTARVEAGNMDGYNYIWTAPEAGKLTVTMPDGGWLYVMNNETSGIYGDTHTSGDDPLVSSEAVEVQEGDKIALMVSTFDPDAFAAPAGSVVFTAAFQPKYPLGCLEKPIVVEGNFPIVTDVLEAGATVYYKVSGCDGMKLTADAAITVDGAAYDGSLLSLEDGQSILLAVTNDTAEAASFTVNLEAPLGSKRNPDALDSGNMTFTLEENNKNGYYLEWTAADAGTLVVTMTGQSWQYSIANVTAGENGIWKNSTVGTDAMAVLHVSQGDKVSLILNAFDPEAPTAYPGGELSINTTFAKNKKLEMKVLKQETLASATAPAITTGTLTENGTLTLVVTGVKDSQTSQVVDYTLKQGSKTFAGVGDRLTVHANVRGVSGRLVNWTVTPEGGVSVEVSYTLMLLYEVVEPAEVSEEAQ